MYIQSFSIMRKESWWPQGYLLCTSFWSIPSIWTMPENKTTPTQETLQNEWVLQKIGKTSLLCMYPHSMTHQLIIVILMCHWKKLEIHIFSIVNTEDHARNDHNSPITTHWTSIEILGWIPKFETDCHIVKCQLKFHSSPAMNSMKNKKMTTYSHWSSVRCHRGWIHWH